MTRTQLRALVAAHLKGAGVRSIRGTEKEHRAVLEDAWREVMPRHVFLANALRRARGESGVEIVLARMLALLDGSRPRRRSAEDRAVEAEMLAGIEEGIWLDSWASAVEELGREVPRHITLDTAPAVPASASKLARAVARAITRVNGGRSLASIAASAERADRRPIGSSEASGLARRLGYDLAMQIRGHGISWLDDHAFFPLVLPSGEWYATRERVPGRGARWLVEGYVSDRLARSWR